MTQATQQLATHPMRRVRVEKLTLNIGAGKDAQLLNKGVKLLEAIAGVPPVKTVTSKRIPGWGLRPGLPIGCKITLRGAGAEGMIPRLLAAKDQMLGERNYDNRGNVSFGIPEYIDIEGAKYDPEIGIIGLQACITLTRAGYRVKRRRLRPASVGRRQVITKDEAMAFMQERFSVKVGEHASGKERR
nr:50S ribosomal protein L5P [uncultured archaeon]